MPRKKENKCQSSMELRCLEKTSEIQTRLPGQRSTGGKPPRKALSTRVTNQIRRPTRLELIHKRRQEALRLAAQEYLDGENATVSTAAEETATEKIPETQVDTSAADQWIAELSPEAMDWNSESIATASQAPVVNTQQSSAPEIPSEKSEQQ